MTRGMVLGKFMPPHAGHVFLCDVARRMTDELVIVVGSLAREPIAGTQRVAWMKELFPDAIVVHHTDENPQYPEEHPDFWAIWKASLGRVLPGPVDVVFAGEAYGKKLAEVLGARFVPVDRKASSLAGVSGTAIREDPLAHWDHIPPCVRAHYVKRVSVFGPESTGKTTLANALAEHFDTSVVPELARQLLEANDAKLDLADMEMIVKGQIAFEESLVSAARGVLVCDTDPLATRLWAKALFDADLEVPDRAYDLTLLCAPDVPWVADPVRYLPEGGKAFFAACEAELTKRGRAYVTIAGSWDERFATATRAIEALLQRRLQ